MGDGTTSGYSRAKFEDIGDWIDKFDKKMDTMQNDITTIKTKQASISTELSIKSGVWGLLGGGIPVSIAIIIAAIKGWF